ncbi:hypothetical protein DPM19_09330 [Actinomadura craniellae]|uniref:Uncharacterized protein n=1 Tax=Actinomadura craniellae TaxID=2231787 RepID=A0A365H9X5_9ACTN|nr:hypothetical protein [Actinomadura craniellae]RAY15940.1 hypothetical protein DPM19_09330 [Actinomadura craniellae]
MHRPTSLTELAAVFGATADGRSCRIDDGEADAPICLEGVRAERLELTGCDVDGPLLLRDCFIDDLRLSGCAAEGIVIAGCHVQRLVIRNLPPGSGVSVSEGDYERISIHDVGEISLDAIECQGGVTVTGIRGQVELNRVTAKSVSLGEQLTAAPDVRIRLSRVRVMDNLEIHDLRVLAVDLRDCLVDRNLRLRRLSATGQVVLDDVRCEGRLFLGGVTSRAAILITGSTLRDGLEGERLRSPADGSPVLTLTGSAVGSSIGVTLATQPGEVILRDTAVDGRLTFPAPSPRYRIEGVTTIGDVQLPPTPVGSTARLRELADRHFGESGATAYGVLRAAFAVRQRMREEDLCYFLQRHAEVRFLPWHRRWLGRYVLGGVLGWGVSIVPPVRALSLGILVTGLVLTATGAGKAVSPGDLPAGLTLAAALWFNVGTGLPQGLGTGRWTALAVTFTVTGLLLVTIIVGITIRRLVR